MLAHDDLRLLEEAARAAGDIARGYFRRDPKKWDKPDSQGPVTECDLAVDEMLKEKLLSARPDYGWLSEETPDDPARLDHNTLFVIDPLDGTRAFIEGSPTWAHSLAVVKDGIPVAAAVYLPINDKMFTAATGHGAQLNGESIHATNQSAVDGASILVAKPGLEPHNWVNADVPNFKRSFRSSLAYRLSLIGQGRYDSMISLRATWEWDVAAGALIVTEAGGVVTDRKGAQLRFNNAHPQVNGIVAAGSSLHPPLVGRIL